jgi:hypothetical protein
MPPGKPFDARFPLAIHEEDDREDQFSRQGQEAEVEFHAGLPRRDQFMP